MFDTVIESRLPPALDTMAPGPVLAALLSAIDVTEVCGYDRVVVLRAHHRLACHYAAEVHRDMAAITNSYQGLTGNLESAPEDAAAEIQAALSLTLPLTPPLGRQRARLRPEPQGPPPQGLERPEGRPHRRFQSQGDRVVHHPCGRRNGPSDRRSDPL